MYEITELMNEVMKNNSSSSFNTIIVCNLLQLKCPLWKSCRERLWWRWRRITQSVCFLCLWAWLDLDAFTLSSVQKNFVTLCERHGRGLKTIVSASSLSLSSLDTSVVITFIHFSLSLSLSSLWNTAMLSWRNALHFLSISIASWSLEHEEQPHLS